MIDSKYRDSIWVNLDPGSLDSHIYIVCCELFHSVETKALKWPFYNCAENEGEGDYGGPRFVNIGDTPDLGGGEITVL